MSNIPLPIAILIAGLFIGFRVAVFFYKAYEDKRSIAIYLSRLGATNIRSAWDVAAGTRDTYMYDVTYIGADGRPHRARCKIGGSYTENEIYWSEPPEV
ncbi:MAG: hypothetical protein U0559_18210 [Anaerolineae bacterium]